MLNRVTRCRFVLGQAKGVPGSSPRTSGVSQHGCIADSLFRAGRHASTPATRRLAGLAINGNGSLICENRAEPLLF